MNVIPQDQIPALDASYRTIRVLAQGPGGTTELVRSAQGAVLVRKHVPLAIANPKAWMTLAQIKSPLLPHVEALYEMPGELVIVLTYVDGITLEELVGSTGAIEPTTAARYLCDLCEAVSLLHARGVIHRDLSPGNVVIAGDRARIIDLGNARVHEEGARKDTTTLGTFGFAAPEQFGFAQTDARSDVYSLGSLLGYMLTGVRPDEPGFESALAQESSGPAVLRAAVLRAREFEPSQRFQSVSELAQVSQGYATIPVERVVAQPWPMTMLPEPAKGGLPQLLKLVGSWMFWLFWVACFVKVEQEHLVTDDLYAKWFYVFYTAVGVIANVAMGVQTHQEILRTHDYAATDNPRKLLVKRLRLIAIVMLLAMLAGGIVLAFFNRT